MTEQENIQELRNYFVYEIRRPIETGDVRRYVGISSYTKHGGPKKRFSGHRKSSYYVGFFIRKYPDVKMYILHDNLTKEEACAIEKALVPKTDKERKELNLLNETEGGGIPPKFNSLSKESQDKIREQRKINAQKQTHVSKRPPGPSHSGSKEYRLLDPNGVLHEGKCMQELCRKYNLKHPNLSKVNTGKKKSYKGWTSPDYVNSFIGPQKGEHNKMSKRFRLKSPSGEIFEGVGFKHFCDENNLNYDSLLKVTLGIQYEWNGWTNPDSNLKPKEIKSYTIISPDNKTYTFSNISAFEREHGFRPASLSNLLNGKVMSCNNWTTPEMMGKRKEYVFIDPNGIEHKTCYLTGFAKEHNLHPDELSRLHRRKIKQYKKWTIPKNI